MNFSIQIYDGYSRSPIAELSGQTGARTVTTISDSVVLYFYTNSFATSKGWNMSWSGMYCA